MIKLDKIIGLLKILGEPNGEKKDLCVSVDKMEEIYVECAIMGITQLYDLFYHEYLYFIA
jgi:hypothetical protein